MYESETIPVSTHPFDQRTVPEIRIMRITAETHGNYGLELKLGDRYALLTFVQAGQLQQTIGRARNNRAHQPFGETDEDSSTK